jgi:hypothetical protein
MTKTRFDGLFNKKPGEKVGRVERSSMESATAQPFNTGRMNRRGNPNYQQVSGYIRKETHASVKIALIREGAGRDLSDVLEELLTKWLEEQKAKSPNEM